MNHHARTRVAELLQRGAGVGFPTIASRGTAWTGEAAWVHRLTDAFPVELDEIERQLSAVEQRQARTAEFDREYDERRDRLRQADREAQASALRDLLGR